MNNDRPPGDGESTDFGFTRVPLGEKTARVREVFESVAPSYDVMNDAMSFGLHRVWKRFAVARARPRPGERWLDLAAGTGDITRLLAARVGSRGRVMMTDINFAMLEHGRDRLLDGGSAANIDLALADAERLPFPDRSFDGITIAFGLRNVTRKDIALAEMHRVLRPGGRALVLEFSRLAVPALEKLYDGYSFNVLPWLGQRLAGDGDSYRYLAESIRRHPDQETLRGMMEAAGFERCRYLNLAAGIVAVHDGLRL